MCAERIEATWIDAFHRVFDLCRVRADRFALGHFDLPVRNCTIALDGAAVVEAGRPVDLS